MRQIARVPRPTINIVRLMIYHDGVGAYLFGFDTLVDAGCRWDEWYETAEDAQGAAEHNYGVGPADWQPIPDPLPHCYETCIAPVRPKGSPDGNPQHGRLETLVNNEWVDFHPEQL
ncbi:hypothetical protein [Hymenobacter edaphi]|uniref:Uncharacterized protein n=1 Tax=Hymenobacter edaphi TaxID=2211146 RepID=A0A328B7V8_9BACT|nr:hypothetical protein [Hymenobacter edaphi]RAK63223.1 hypothetical protein DLM85_21800 [Hymenobacter edaphi]